jgi:Bifunctional DNA primase/polymerase, N-terminal
VPDSPMLNAALAYAALGWPVFPCRRAGKAPAWPSAHPNAAECRGACGRFGHGFYDASTDPDRVVAMFRPHPQANVAVATGAPGPDVLDVDTKDGRDGMSLFEQARQAGLLRGAGALVRTPSGGLHVWFDGTQQPGGAVGKHKALELKAVGGYVLLPPSYVADPDRGYAGRYELIERRDTSGTVDFAAIRRLLDPPALVPAKRRKPRDPNMVRPGDDFNARATWAEILLPHGWVYLSHKGQVGYWRRPDKTAGISATTNALGTDRLRVFTTSTKFETTSYSKFGAYALLNHDGDHRTAAEALRQLGYGAQEAA